MSDHAAPALARDLATLRARLLAAPVPRRRALALLGATVSDDLTIALTVPVTAAS